ncbi:MAG: hypothetical protein AAB223_08545, partial [Pseudomonadota bacterium]
MTPGARLQAAIEILEQSFAAPFPVDATLEAYFRRRRYAGSGDRRAVQERVFNILRRKARLAWHVGRIAAAVPSPRALALADLIVGELLSADEAANLFASSRHAPAPLTETERALARALEGSALDDPAMPDPVRHEYPAWLEQSLRVAFGDRMAEEMSALNRQAPLDLRVNAAKATREAAQAALAAENVAADPTPLSPSGLRVKGALRIGGTRAFKQGLVEVQDEGSQIVAALVGARPGMTVVDFCAGAGGKTLALAAAMLCASCEGTPTGVTRAQDRGARQGKNAGRPACAKPERLRFGEGRLIACDTSSMRLDRMTARL